MRLPGTILLVLAPTLGLVTALGGCSAGSARLTATSVPADFTLEVRDASGDGALYIVEPDRWFRAATGATPDGYFYPPATRLLTPEQMEELWATISDSGLLALDGVEVDRPAILVEVQANDKRSVIQIDSARGSGGAPLLEMLRKLAWLEP